MITLSKIFRFEAAHAIHNYPGSCAHIHGHSYELHVSVKAKASLPEETYLEGLGILLDFKVLKEMVKSSCIDLLDHKLLLSKQFIESNPVGNSKELVVLDFEPTAENLLIYIRKGLQKQLPDYVTLASLRLWETRDSYAEWLA